MKKKLIYISIIYITLWALTFLMGRLQVRDILYKEVDYGAKYYKVNFWQTNDYPTIKQNTPPPFYYISVHCYCPFYLNASYGALWRPMAGHGSSYHIFWFFNYIKFSAKYDRWDS